MWEQSLSFKKYLETMGSAVPVVGQGKQQPDPVSWAALAAPLNQQLDGYVKGATKISPAAAPVKKLGNDLKNALKNIANLHTNWAMQQAQMQNPQVQQAQPQQMQR